MNNIIRTRSSSRCCHREVIRSLDMDRHHRIAHFLLDLLIMVGFVAFACSARDPGENNAADNIHVETKHVTDEDLVVAIQDVIRVVEDKYATVAHQFDELREELRESIEESCTEGQRLLGKNIKSVEKKCLEAEKRIKEEIKTRVDTMTSKVTRDHEALREEPATCPVASDEHDAGHPLPSNCAEIKDRGNITSGVYVISLPDGKEIEVYCDMTTAGGGWTVLQRRADITPHVNFNRRWSDYKKGFGHLEGEFWLGLDNIHSLTSQPSTPVRLRIDLMENRKGEVAYAEYETFVVSAEGDLYRLSVGGYTGRGGAGDSLMPWNNGQYFSTLDRDNDGFDVRDQSAYVGGGGWWHGSVLFSSLNGPYLWEEVTQYKTFFWWTWKERDNALKTSEMKIRPN